MVCKITQIKKRNGNIALFNEDKISNAIFNAAKAVGGQDKERAKLLAKEVVELLEERGFSDARMPSVEDVQDGVEKILVERGHAKTAKRYILYREQHKRMRDLKNFINSNDIMDGYLNHLDWRIKENSNMSFSLQGLNNHISSIVSSNYWLHKIYPPEVRRAHLQGDLHIHDLQLVSAYCCGWDLKDLLMKGFGGVPGKIESKAPKHFRAALGQVTNFLYTTQGEVAGANAFSSFDSYLAPLIHYDKLEYGEIKQAMQEFLFNMNVPTRVGFQCLSEDTEILTPDGWKKYSQVKKGDKIKTFNLKNKTLETKKVKNMFKKKYSGIMYNLKNRIQDQLISPEHRIIRKKFNTDNYILESIEKTSKLKSPFIIPIAGKNVDKDVKVSNEQIKLLAWIISEGTIERKITHRVAYRITIYQSKIKNRTNYNEIKKLLKHFKLEYSESESIGLGQPVNRFRLNAGSSKKIHKWFGTRDSIKFIPKNLLEMSQKQSRLFLETYIKGDGTQESKIAVADKKLLNQLQQTIVNSGYGFTVLKRAPTLGKKIIYILRVIRHTNTYINKVKKVKYNGIIWCPTTDNETVIAKRNGKVFITGNCPFTNITMDMKIPSILKHQPVIFGGELQKDTYGDFQTEADMLNKAFAEVMIQGDAKGRLFTFPIPTYNITKDLDWDNEVYDGIWEMTAKYGIPYFSNFINSDMSPDDVRSMCCRLRLSNGELRKRGGGLFGANPLTGSTGVVTMNMPRLAYLSRNPSEFKEQLAKQMDIARTSLEIKKRAVERFTEAGLYPYSKHYLKDVKKATGSYWGNHFNTIGLIGMNEACMNLLGVNIAEREGRYFALDILDFMRERMSEYQEKSSTNSLYNLEATPGEGTGYRLARLDRRTYPEIITAGDREPYYTNSTHLPVNYTDDIFEALRLQDSLQCKYTGGCIEKGNKVLSNKGALEIEYIVKNFDSLKPIKALSYNAKKGTSEWDEIIDAIAIDVKKKNKIRIIAERKLDIVTSDWHPFFVLEKTQVESICPICKKEIKNLKAFASHLRHYPGCRKKYKSFPKYKVIEKRADELKKNDYILQNSTNLFTEKIKHLDEDLMWLIGFFISDGCLSLYKDNRSGNNLVKYTLRFFSEHKEILKKVKIILKKFFKVDVQVRKNDKRSEKLREVATNKKSVIDFFFKYGFKNGKKVYGINIPSEVKKNITQNNLNSLLAGLIDGDGYISKKDGSIEYYTVSQELAKDILEICTQGGILINVASKLTKRKNEVNGFRLRIPAYEATRIKNNLKIADGSQKINHNFSNRKKRHLPVVRVKKTSKVNVQDNQFYDLTTKNNHNYLAGKNTFVFIHNTVMHGFLGERIDNIETVKKMVRRIATNFHLPYFTLTPTFSVCKDHGYLKGRIETCPSCETATEVYSRVVGYLRPISSWNNGKAEEFKERKAYTLARSLESPHAIKTDHFKDYEK